MRKKTSLQRITLGLFTILTPFVFFIAGARSATAQCPPQTVPNVHGECVVTRDLTLANTLRLAPNTKLNCASHRLVPVTQGTGRIRSKPEVAIFLNGARNIQIRNCVIDGFDFGVFAINSKGRGLGGTNGPSRIQILQNKIDARFVAISLMTVDDAEIRSNTLTWRTRGGRALYVGRDSDRNRILNNQIAARLDNNFKAFRAPGPESPSNPAVDQNATPPSEGSAVLITQTEGPEPSLLNAVIEGTLFQLTVTDNTVPNEDFTEDNIFNGNTIEISTTPGVKPVDGISLAIPQRTLVSHNNVVGAKISIKVGIQSGPTGNPKQFPGHCNLKQSRLCLGDGDCNIDGIDSTNIPPDTCTLTLQPTKVFWVSRDTIIQNNRISSPLEIGIATAGERTRVMGNTITGNAGPLGGTATGIQLTGKHALETTTVTKNTVRGISVSLSLLQVIQNLVPLSFGAKISLNDFTDYNTAILLRRTQTSPPPPPLYDLFSEISVGLKGNYWGLPCPGFDKSLVKNSGTPATVNSLAVDSHPFGVHVARTHPFQPPPKPCP